MPLAPRRSAIKNARMNAMPPALQFLLHTFAGWVNRKQQDVIDYLQEENRVLREQRLCRYGLRAPFSVKCFSLLADGRVRYELRRPWPTPNGATELNLKPLDLLRRLAALIPTPYTNLVRYHGVFANRSRYRKQLPPPPPSPHHPSTVPTAVRPCPSG